MVVVLLEAAKIGAAAAIVKAPAKAPSSSSAAAAAEAAGAKEARHLEGPLDGQELGPDRGAVQRGDAVVGRAPWLFSI